MGLEAAGTVPPVRTGAWEKGPLADDLWQKVGVCIQGLYQLFIGQALEVRYLRDIEVGYRPYPLVHIYIKDEEVPTGISGKPLVVPIEQVTGIIDQGDVPEPGCIQIYLACWIEGWEGEGEDPLPPGCLIDWYTADR